MKVKINTNTIIGVLATLVSLGTLFVLIYQSRLMREHEEKSSVPKLELWNDLSEGNYALSIFNKGLGPAIIEKVVVQYEAQDFDMDPMQFSFQYADSLSSGQSSVGGSSLYQGVIVQEGQKIRLMHSTDSASTALLKMLFYFGEQKKAKLVVHYSSIYGKVWKLDGTGDLPNIEPTFEPKVFHELFNE